ncbi:MAG: transporter associated domain-containing protein, partial [Flavobacteriia bacterium]
EHDKEALTEQQVSASEFLFSARIDIDYLNENYGFNLPESESYDTLAGLILSQLERLPSEGDEVQVEHFKLVVEKMSERKIETIRFYHVDN